MKEADLSEQAPSHKVERILEQLPKKLTRQVVASLVGCVHCGMCNYSCHYVMTHPDDPKMTPSYKADQLRKLFKANHDWTGSVFPWWVGADQTPLTDDDLEKLKDIAFGTCTNCRRCTVNCPMGVDTATLNRMMRGLLTHVGVMPEGVKVVSKDQWEIGNQMGVLKEDYLDTLEWMGEELSEDNLTTKRPGTGISPMRWDEVVGRRQRDEELAAAGVGSGGGDADAAGVEDREQLRGEAAQQERSGASDPHERGGELADRHGADVPRLLRSLRRPADAVAARRRDGPRRGHRRCGVRRARRPADRRAPRRRRRGAAARAGRRAGTARPASA